MPNDDEQFTCWLAALAAWRFEGQAELDEPCSLCPHPDACETADECLKNL